MDLYFLEARVPLTKTFVRKGKKVKKHPYPLVRNVTSHKEYVPDLAGFRAALQAHAGAGHALLKGELQRELNIESRAGSTDPFSRTSWLCLDIDHFEDASRLGNVLGQLGLADTSYVIQYAAGHGIYKKFSAHLFFLLDKPVLPEQLKFWLMCKNLEIPELRNQITLTRTNLALRWPLDVAVAHNATLIYIAPPICENFDDPIEDRIQLVQREHDKATLGDEIGEIDSSVVNEQKQRHLNQMRRDKGLGSKKLTTKTIGNVEVASNPEEVTVTGHKQERGFMYLNLNGGDSWGYYHPVDNPEIIYNFKGEPNYLTKKLVPAYYRAYRKAELKAQQQERGEDSLQFFAFLDRRTDRYYRGTYNPEHQELELFPTDSLTKVQSFLKQNNQFVGDYIEEWDYLFRFDDSRIYVPEERFVNRYCQTPYLKDPKAATPGMPPTIYKVLNSVVGGNTRVLKHFLNWLAFIIQYRQRAQTMWVLNGVQGTGKGVLVHEILKPIIGDQCVQVKSLSDLEEQFNGYMENCVLLMIDESKKTQVKNKERVMATLKQCSTDPVVSIRRMRVDHYMAKNYMNIIITSNYPDPIIVEATDRRFNVGDYQSQRLHLTKEEVEEQIPEELPAFVAMLHEITVDVDKAKTPLNTRAREQLKFLTQTSLDVVFGAIKDGNLDFFIDDLPTDQGIRDDPLGALQQDKYISVLREAERNAHEETEHRLTRDQLWLLAEYTLGEMPKSANRFTSLIKHYGIDLERKRKDSRMVQCIDVQWKKPEVTIDDVVEQSKLRAVK